MSVQFARPNGHTLDLANGIASRLLYVIGYPVGEDSDGWMSCATARDAVDDIKTWPIARRPEFLAEFEAVVAEHEQAGWDTIRWS